MKGFPKHFETKMDYMNSLKLFPEETKRALRTLYADRFIWKKEKELKSREEGKEDLTHQIIENDNKIFQFKKVEDPNARYLRLGFTKKEINKILEDKYDF